MSGYKIGWKDTKRGNKRLVVAVENNGKTEIVWHQTMGTLIALRKSGVDINAMVKDYATALSKVKTEIVPKKPAVEELDFDF